VPDLLLTGGRPWRFGSVADILVHDGRIAAIADAVDAPAAERIDLAGAIVLPGFVDAHCHLDKTLFGGEWVPNSAGAATAGNTGSAGEALADRIANERRRRAEFGLPNRVYIAALLERMVANGTSYVRTHTDIDPDAGLRGVEAVSEAAAQLAGRVTVEQVAFPQSGILTSPGTAELLEAALANGVTAIGGLDPAGVDRDPVRHLDIVFGLAERYGAAVDLHLHDPGTLGAWQLELIAERTAATGLSGRVTVSHAYALAHLDESAQDKLLERLAATGVNLVTAAVYSFPVPPLKKLNAAGVTVGCGHDGIRDLWGPYGSADMLDRAMHLAYRSAFRRDEDIELALHAATYGGAQVLGLDEYGLAIGAAADLVVVRASTPAHAVVAHPPRTFVLKGGRVVARNGELV
jgi:cytosine deaminase